MSVAGLSITVNDPARFPPGTRIGLFYQHDVSVGVIPWARALDPPRIVPGPVDTRVIFTTPSPDRAAYAVAGVVDGQVRTVRVTAERPPSQPPVFHHTVTFGRVVREQFPPGTPVALVEVARGATRSAGGHKLALGTADSTGTVDFPDAQFGSYYFVVGKVAGRQVEIPVRPQSDEVWDGVPRFVPPSTGPPPPPPTSPLAPPALRGNEMTLSWGRGGPVRQLQQLQADVPTDVVQASDTPLGVATPINPAGVAKIQSQREARL
jgi:hypothetical protein